MGDGVAVIGIGANLGSREATVRAAAALLDALPGCAVVARSALYLTEPLGPTQPAYVNAAVALRSALPPEALLDHLLAVEKQLGRERRERWGPRTLDLDLLWLSTGPVSTPRLRVPHPELHRRAFALAPLLDVLPALEPEYGPSLARFGVPPRIGHLQEGIGRPAPSTETVASGLDSPDAVALAVTALAVGRQGGPAAARLSHALTCDPEDPLGSLARGVLAAQADGYRVAAVAVPGPGACLVGERAQPLAPLSGPLHSGLDPEKGRVRAWLRIRPTPP